MRKSLSGVLLFLLVVNAVLAYSDDKNKKADEPKLYEKKGDKERIYNLPLDKLWAAALKTAAEDNVVEFTDKETGIFTYKSGVSAASWGFKISVSLTKIDDTKTRIKLTTQKTRGQLVAWGAGGRTVEKYFKALDKMLADTAAH
jgi:hypothetical protein